MAAAYTGHDVFMGKTITCTYNGKAREGKVIATTSTYMKIEYMTDSGMQYRNLSYEGCIGITIKE